MDKQGLFDRLAAMKAKVKVPDLAALGEDTTIPATFWHELCYDQRDDSIAFRAAWVLEYIAAYHPRRFVPVLLDFLSILPNQENLSCQRHFTKILMAITSPQAPKAYQETYRLADHERLVETIFEWLIRPQTPVAVQVNCMDILFNMSTEFEWITEELKSQVEFLMRDGSAAMQSRGKKVLGKLKC